MFLCNLTPLLSGQRTLFSQTSGGKSFSETQGQIVGPKTKIKTGGKKFDEQIVRKKNMSPGARIFLSYFCSSNFFPPVLILISSSAPLSLSLGLRGWWKIPVKPDNRMALFVQSIDYDLNIISN